MRHVPGFDQGWRGYERQDKDPGSIMTLDPRLRMSGTSVGDDSRKKGKKSKDAGSPIRSGMTNKDKERTQRHEMARLQKTREKHWIHKDTGSPIKNVGDKRRG